MCVFTCGLCFICMNLDAPYVPFDPKENERGNYFNALLCWDTWRNKPKAGAAEEPTTVRGQRRGASRAPEQTHQSNLLQSVSSLLSIRNPPRSASRRLTGGNPHWYQISDVEKGGLNTEGLGETSGGWVGLRMLYTIQGSSPLRGQVFRLITEIAIKAASVGNLVFVWFMFGGELTGSNRWTLVCIFPSWFDANGRLENGGCVDGVATDSNVDRWL